MRRRRPSERVFILGVIVFLLIIIVALPFTLFSDRGNAKDFVQQFYEFEQNGDFAQSWELFHPEMQAKFKKSTYIQDRAHVFMNHFGADSFSFDVSKGDKLQNWQMEEGGETFGTVQQFVVRKAYIGKYGNFEFVQQVFVVKVDKEWRLLWDYNS